MRRLYDDNLYRFDTPQASYWEATAPRGEFDCSPLDRDQLCDVAIIGGGYTGLSAALHLARDYSVDVRVLEAGHIGWGASGRNGGFCCIGGTGLNGAGLIRHFGLESARDYYRSQVEAVELVRDLGRDENIDLQPFGSAEVEIAHSKRAYAGLESACRLMTEVLGLDAEILGAGEARERIYDSTEQFGALISRPAFGLHPLQYCRGLAGAAVRRGAVLHADSEVISWARTGDGSYELRTRGGVLRAKRVIFATNGFMPEQLHRRFRGCTLPVISAIVVTRPLSSGELALQGWQSPDPAINSRHVLNYFRLLPDNRFLFGARGHTRGSVEGEQATYEKILRTFRRIWPAWRDIDIEHRWHGLICMTGSMRPAVGRLDDEPGVYFGFGYHGNGVNTATWAGKQLADWIGRGSVPRGLPSIVKGLPRRYPFPGLRRVYLRTGLAIANWLDSR
jgi:glycine/D-amino acid oxidase-like deaminating enzyme